MIGGTRNWTTTAPLMRPMIVPKAVAAMSTSTIEAGSPEIILTARKAQKFITNGIERSMPPSPVAIGNIWPMPDQSQEGRRREVRGDDSELQFLRESEDENEQEQAADGRPEPRADRASGRSCQHRPPPDQERSDADDAEQQQTLDHRQEDRVHPDQRDQRPDKDQRQRSEQSADRRHHPT